MAKAQPKPNKGNNPMYVNNDKHIESSKINYLTGRLDNSFYAAECKIPPAFHTDTPSVPKTAEDVIAAITAGNYTLKDKDSRRYCYPLDQIIWRSPSIVPDPKGAEAASKELKSLYQTASDTIAIGTPAEGLAAVQKMDTWTPTVATAAPATA
jgi:hypothetical protein